MQNVILTYIQGLLTDETHSTTDRNIGKPITSVGILEMSREPCRLASLILAGLPPQQWKATQG